ncbi:hypothetical protein D7D52_36005 [Nocardia yunnanensis]|uniref:Uncharacterized protein n=2 Tax=Nocardia yunnanensis TaxID=2382165 RepID=A0A386ZME3_9NOCA|nr:hypothetical protein D7D52_36005 [Nocardia yunnanensis]
MAPAARKDRKDLEIASTRKHADTGDDWADATATKPAVREEPVKKLSLEFPESVHRATKAGAALRGNTMLGEIVQMCRARNGMAPWPADIIASVKAQIAAEAAEAGEHPGEEFEAEAVAPAPAKKARAPRKRVL